MWYMCIYASQANPHLENFYYDFSSVWTLAIPGLKMSRATQILVQTKFVPNSIIY